MGRHLERSWGEEVMEGGGERGCDCVGVVADGDGGHGVWREMSRKRGLFFHVSGDDVKGK